MSLARLIAFALCATCLLAVSPAAAGKPTAESIAKLLQQLNDDSYQIREQATAELIKLGQPAVEAVAGAAEGESLEVSRRCMQALTVWHGSDNADLKASATNALKRLAKSKHEHVASKARELTESPKELVPAANPFKVQIRQLQIARQGGMRIQNNNGFKTIDVNDNGKQIHIEEDPQGAIKVKVTEKVDGKDKSTTHEAKTADELKKKHPEAFKLYQKYGQARGAAIAVQIVGRAIQLRPAVPPATKAADVKKALEQIEAAQKQLKESVEAMHKLAQSKAPAEDAKRMAQQIEAAIKQLEEARRQLK